MVKRHLQAAADFVRGRKDRRRDADGRIRWQHKHDVPYSWARIGGSTVLGALATMQGVARNANNDPEPNVSVPPASAPFNPGETGSLADRETRSFTDRISVERTERTAVPAAPEKVGVLIEMDAANFANHQLYLTQDEKELTIFAYPVKSADANTTISTATPNYDPLHVLKSNVPPNVIKDALQRCRECIKTGEDIYLGNLDAQYMRSQDISVTSRHSMSAAGKQQIDLDPNQTVVFRIAFDKNQITQLKAISRAVAGVENLVRDVDAELSKPDQLIYFAKEALLDPKTRAFNADSKRTLQYLFALSPEERKAFTTAIGNNNIDEARKILFLRGKPSFITEDTYYALLNYIKDAKSNGIDHESATAAIPYGLAYYSYDSMQNESSSSQDRAVNFMQRNLTRAQYDELSALPSSSMNLITEYFAKQGPSASHGQSYHSFIKALEDRLPQLDESDRASAAKLLPPHTLDAIRRHLRNISDTNPGNWFDRNSRENNLLTIIGLIEQQQLLSANKQNGRLAIEDLISQIDKQGHLTFEIPLAEMPNGKSARSGNEWLGSLSAVLRAAFTEQNILDRTHGHDGRARTLHERLAEYFSYHVPANTGDIAHIISPVQVAAIIANTVLPSVDLPTQSSQEASTKDRIFLSNTRKFGDIAVSDISAQKVTAAVEAEVRLPASGASAASGR